MNDEDAAYRAVTDPRVAAVLDVIAPRAEWNADLRLPLFEWGHETTPTAAEMIDLAERIVAAIDRDAPLT